MALTGTKALIVWCQQVTHGYKDVEIRNMTSSWRDGLAFCAILHHYRPDLINFDKLAKENIAENNHLAFTVAEQELDIPALLDVEDMVELTVPDKLSIMTYVSQYYQYFRDKVPGQIPKRHAPKRHSPYTMEDLPKTKITPGVKAAKEVIGATPNPPVGKGTIDRFCANCGKTVYLMERLQIEGKLFHRVCFTCATCASQLRMGTYRYIPIEDKFYCDKHYRQRTTSLSSDDSIKVHHDSNKNEQDALKNLLESLENKRRIIEEKESDKLIMKHDSVHQRIADARKKFTETSNSNISNHQRDQHSDGSPRSAPRHPPPRPAQPPGKEFDSHEETFDSKSVTPSANVTSITEVVRGVKHEGPPSRPANPPGQFHEANSRVHDHHIKDREKARGLLTGVLPKLEKADRKELNKTEDESNAHIYETPFLCNSTKVENDKDGEKGDLFENPRYRESLRMESKPIYENQGPSLLTLEARKPAEELKKNNEGEVIASDEEEHSSDAEHQRSSKPKTQKKLILKVRRKSRRNNAKSGVSINLEASGETESDAFGIPKGEDQTQNSSSTGDVQMELVDKESYKEDGHKKDVKEFESEKDHTSVVDSIKGNGMEVGVDAKEFETETIVESIEDSGKEAGKDMKVKEEDIFEPEGGISIMRDEVENRKLERQGIEDAIQSDEIHDNEKKEERRVGDEVKASVYENVAEELDEEPQRKVGEEKADSEIFKGDNKEESVIDIEQVEKKGETGGIEGLTKTEERAPYDCHIKNEDQRSRKVLQYVNPFDETDDEELDNSEQKAKDEFTLNPFEIDSGDEKVESRQDQDYSYSSDDGIGRAVSRKIKLIPGEGPKTALTPEELAEHQRKIEIIKKELMKNENEEARYRNPFEESDDDLMDTEKSKYQETSDKRNSAEHHKKLVLKVKKKRRAPQPPEEKRVATVDQVAMQEEVKSNIKHEENMEEKSVVKPSLTPADPLETFKTYIQNSEVEMRKRLDSKASIVLQQENLEYKETSPTSASCPTLNKIELYDEHRVDDTSLGSDEGTRNVGAHDATEIADKASGRKEKAPKRPAPPVPKGITPFKEISGSDIERVPSPCSTEIEPDGNDKATELQKAIGNKKGEIKKQVINKMNETEECEKKRENGNKKKDRQEYMKSKEKKQEIVTLNEKETKQKNLKVKDKKKEKEKVKGKQYELGKKKKKEKVEKKERDEIEDQGSGLREIVDEKDENFELKRTFSIVEDKEMSLDDIAIELKEIEEKQRLLEQRGVKMEKRLRDQLHGEPEEDYMITWFDLVTEKNKLLRRENELIYMSQEIEYHGYQKKIEFELRLLMEKDESLKTQEDHDAEEQLLQQLVSYVARRNKIVEKMEQDRIREREEDEQIQMIMQAQGLRKQKKKKAGKKISSGSTFYT